MLQNHPQLAPNATKHPFRGAKDASYVPAITKSTGVQQTGNKKQEPAFRTLPPVHDAVKTFRKEKG